MFDIGFAEMLILGVIAVLLFGKRLPEVAKSLGASYNQFRRGLNDLRSEFHTSTYVDPYESPPVSAYESSDDLDVPTAPKFEPPPAEPQSLPNDGGAETSPIASGWGDATSSGSWPSRST